MARIWVSFSVKWLCAPRGPETELVFSLSWFSRWWRGAGFFFWSNGFALRAGQRQGGVFRLPPPYLWTPLSPQRVKGCSPLTIPKKWAPSKNAFSEAASIFPLRLPLRGLKGASSPFLVDPARRNRWCFSGSLLTSKENISLNANALCPAHRRDNQLKEKTSPALWPARSASHLTERKNLPHAAGAPARSASLYRFATAISARFSSRIRSSTVFTAVSTSAFGMRAMSTAHA